MATISCYLSTDDVLDILLVEKEEGLPINFVFVNEKCNV